MLTPVAQKIQFSYITQIPEILGLITDLAKIICQFSPRDVLAVRISSEEAMVNAIKHGHEYDNTKSVTCLVEAEEGRFFISVQDQGRGFDPKKVPDPTDAEYISRPCGRGLHLMRHYMAVEYNVHGNQVTMTKTTKS